MTMIQALRSAMDVMLERDDNVVVFGEDVGYFGGVFRCTEGLQAKYGKHARVRHADRRGGIVGAAVGMGAYGLRPVVEIQFADYFYPAFDQIVRGRAAALPLGRRLHRAADHPHALRRRHLRRPDPQPEPGGAVHPRLRPAHRDAQQPLRRQGPADRRHRVRRPGDLPRAQAALQRPLRRPPRPPVVPWSKHRWARCPKATTRCRWNRRRGVAPRQRGHRARYGTMVWVCEAGVRETGIDAEIIDLRSLWPLDLDTIVASVKKTGRCVIVHEATRTSGFGAELSALVQEHCFYHLEAPIERVTGWDTPYPHAQEWAYFPGPARVDGGRRAPSQPLVRPNGRRPLLQGRSLG
jgi:2-oxoisovalerate dehydrogenase E1 component beta subunit